ncbi:MAG: PIG-L family deacetylase [Spirochaetaceae bacterium]|nr:MAG: PIG-L family deacetylase [Spirochaetaceae bacterium]
MADSAEGNTTVFALACHPDDIEFMMGGTLFLLKEAGCSLHYMNLANGCCGSTQTGREETARIRRAEGQRAAQMVGALFHESLVDDLEVFYTPELIKKVTAVVRQIRPDIMLLPSPEDYMEDHMTTCRIGVTAAFCRCIPNHPTDPPVEATYQDIVLYHALPYGLRDGLRRKILPDFLVNISSVIDDKERMLACHESQKLWLDQTQGLDSYLKTMREMSAEVAAMAADAAIPAAGEYAEGWRRHSHLGFSAVDRDPLQEILRP